MSFDTIDKRFRKPEIKREAPEEGDCCADPRCSGRLAYIRRVDCSCHINSPCSACTDAPLACEICHEEPK